MPTFRTRRPSGLAESMRRLVGSSGTPTEAEKASAEASGAMVSQRQALAEKARQEAVAARRAETLRADPQFAVEQAAFGSGLDVPVATQLSRAIRGEQHPLLVSHDDEGNPMPPAPYAKPEGVTPDAERRFRSIIASTMANQIATGRTNADQLARAGGEYESSAMLSEASRPGVGVPDANRLIAAAGGKIREPFSNVNPQGLVTDQETGTVTEGSPRLASAARDAVTALGTQRRASGDLSATRSGDITATQPARIEAIRRRGVPGPRGGGGFTPEQVQRWIDSATNAEHKIRLAEWERLPAVERKATPRPTLANIREEVNKRYRRGEIGPAADPEQEDARTRFQEDSQSHADLRGTQLGRWVPGQGFEVKDATGRLVGFYD